MKEFWDDRFSIEEYVYGTEPNTFFKSVIDELVPGTILLPGEGEGRNAVYAARLGWKVHALDFSNAGKHKAMKLASEYQVEFEYDIGDLRYLEYNRKYDAIAVIFVHFPPEVRKSFHKKLISALNTDGIIFIELFDKKQIKNNTGGPKDIDMLNSVAELQNDFRDLDIRLIRNETVQILEGTYHSGQAEVVRMIAFKRF
jgi:hypothetical protein